VATNDGPLSACSGSDCTAANAVQHFIHVVNVNGVSNWLGFTTRATVPNSFVVRSIDEKILVNGVHVPAFDTTFRPPPSADPLAWSGHWPATVTCQGQPGAFHTPCDVVGDPAVMPGENVAVLYATWLHGSSEPNGAYVFAFTIHGTFHGTPVDLHASSPAIRMTD
jgi:hypothetical protein